MQYGNRPLQAFGNDCPTDINSSFTGYYYNDVNPDGTVPSVAQQVSTYNTSTATTIVGAIVHRFDTTTTGRTVVGSAISGFELSKLKVCIQTTWNSASTTPLPGDRVKVTVYYPYNPISGFFGNVSFNLNAESEYEIE
jgi:hypothetical protein